MRGLLLLLLVPACGFGLEPSSGGSSNLPAHPGGPYRRLDNDLATPASEPFVLADRMESYSDPDCAPRAGGGWRCYFTMTTDDDPRLTIGVAEIGDPHQLPAAPPRRVFTAANDPSAPALAPGPNGTLVLFHQLDDDDGPSLAFATSFDGGETFTDGAAIGINGASPSVAFVDGVYHLYFVADGAIWHATSPDPTGFTIDPEPAIVPRPDLPEAFDGASVGDPYVYVSTSDAGRQHWGLFFTGTAVGDPDDPDAGPGALTSSIGYAASFDGISWQRFNGPEPVLVAPAGGPCVVPDGASTLLFFHEEQRLHLGVAAAAP